MKVMIGAGESNRYKAQHLTPGQNLIRAQYRQEQEKEYG